MVELEDVVEEMIMKLTSYKNSLDSFHRNSNELNLCSGECVCVHYSVLGSVLYRFFLFFLWLLFSVLVHFPIEEISKDSSM